MLRKTATGSLVAPRRGAPPPTPLGYVQDTGDPFVFWPITTACIYRTKKPAKCCGNHDAPWCDLKKVHIVQDVACAGCVECVIPEGDPNA